LSCSITELLLIGNIGNGIYTKDSIAVSISTDIGIIPTWESGVACIIAISASPVVATEWAYIGEKITVLIEDWFVLTNVADVGNPVANTKLVIREVVFSLNLSNMLLELSLRHANT